MTRGIKVILTVLLVSVVVIGLLVVASTMIPTHDAMFVEAGWKPVGQTPRGVTIYKKYIPEEGVTVYSANSYETISVINHQR